MSTNTIIGLVVGALVIGAAVFVFTGTAPSEVGENARKIDAGSMQKNTGSGSLKNLFGMTGSFICTVSSDVASGLASGTVYVSDGKVRGDFTTQANGATVAVHMIQTEGYMYNWSDAYPQGVKIKTDVEGATGEQVPMSDMFDANANINYSCDPSTVDTNMFVPPANIEFMDLGAMMKNIPQLQ